DWEKMIRQLFFVFLFIHSTLAKKEPAVKATDKKWLTLNGGSPAVIARGGFSGLFPESSQYAYESASSTGLPGVVMFCDLQFTSDQLAVCQSDIRLDSSTLIADVFPKGQKTYNVNGQDVKGWFAMDRTIDELKMNVTLKQNILSRPSVFDGIFGMFTPDDIVLPKKEGDPKPNVSLWVNVEYDMFYNQHKMSAANYIETSAGWWVPNYISSPEIGFLKAMGSRKNKSIKLIFRFLSKDAVEPTTKEKYGAILGKLSTVKSFASGILVPKEYIWPVNKDLYLEPATTLVADAHKAGLEVYASGFANDATMAYNYSYDPVAEYLKFIDNGQFSVDGLLTDFPPTASEAVACLAQNQNATKVMKSLIISHNGASGDYPGSTDLAYQKAIDDGADIIDCSVQLSKDGVAFCLETADLTGKTTAVTTLIDRASTVPEIQPNSGIFSFDLTWSEIQTLKPQLVSPFSNSSLLRNPANKNKGKFVTLSEFLELAKTKATTGVLINIDNAPYLASKKGFDIIKIVRDALTNATFEKQSTQKVLIQSEDSSVLSAFKDVPTYQRVLKIENLISDAPKKVAADVKKYADAIHVRRGSVVSESAGFFATGFTKVTQEMHAANISVYVSTLANEFVSLLFDYFSDPYSELATLAAQNVDGVITDHPASANAYMRSPCSNPDAKLPFSISPVAPGALLGLVDPEAMPPALPPSPVLEEADLVDPPLPATANISSSNAPSNSTPSPATAPSPKSSSSVNNVASACLSILAAMLLGLLYN
ncbi:hypothetical protein RJ639_035410, partial [Escallonia herrerae]